MPPETRGGFDGLIMEPCPLCGLESKKRLYDHLFYAHSYTKEQIEEFKKKRRREKLIESCTTVQNCKHCEKVFSSKLCLRRHEKKAHPDKYTEKKLARIWCPLCFKIMKHHRDLVHHAQAAHAETPGKYRVEVISFPNVDEFEKWRRSTEEHDVTSRSIVSTKRGPAGKIKYLRCHRAALNAKDKTSIGSTIKHSRKVVPFCTAYMKIHIVALETDSLEANQAIQVVVVDKMFGITLITLTPVDLRTGRAGASNSSICPDRVPE
ncbi:hypothetical protein RB195_001245 [Necator americanus]|uniref:C2H2-type domain-containing protein n=1 Tax=Necator americanus TaxID=51031 RepID=A0ABR1DEM6_NECAM